MLRTISILNVKITNESEKNILEYLFQSIRKGSKKTFVITPNPEMLMYANKHLDYQDKLNSADIALPDGVGLFFAGGVLGEPLQERITGVDFLEKLCRESKNLPISIGFLGGKDGVAKRAAECLLKKYPWLDIVFIGEEWSEKGFKVASSLQLEASRKLDKHTTSYQSLTTNIDILFVAFGVPKQEEWIYENLSKIPVKAAIGVGGAFDFISGTVFRAPFIVRFLGFEWYFDLLFNPGDLDASWYSWNLSL